MQSASDQDMSLAANTSVSTATLQLENNLLADPVHNPVSSIVSTTIPVQTAAVASENDNFATAATTLDLSKPSPSPTPSKSVKIVWRKEVAASNSSWRTRASMLISQDLLVLGAVESNNYSLEHNDFHETKLPEVPTQLYICDTTTLSWSGASLKGKGPIIAPFYYAIQSKQNDKLFTLYPVANYKEKVARLVNMVRMKNWLP